MRCCRLALFPWPVLARPAWVAQDDNTESEENKLALPLVALVPPRPQPFRGAFDFAMLRSALRLGSGLFGGEW